MSHACFTGPIKDEFCRHSRPPQPFVTKHKNVYVEASTIKCTVRRLVQFGGNSYVRTTCITMCTAQIVILLLLIADLTNSTWVDVDLTEATHEGATLTGATFERCSAAPA